MFFPQITYRSYALVFYLIIGFTSLNTTAQITGAWSQSGPNSEWQAQAGSVYVRLISSTAILNIQTETMGCAGAYSDAAVDNNPSLRFTANTPTTGNFTFGFFDAASSTTQVFVDSPLIHVDRVGGSFGIPVNQLSNSALFTLANGTWTELSENGTHFVTTATTFARTTGVLMNMFNSPECTTSPTAGSAAGSLQLSGAYSTISINTSQAPGGPDGGDAIELVFTGMTILPPTLTVSKTANPTGDVSPGETITYTIDVENTGSIDARTVTLDDVLPAGVTYTAASAQKTYYIDSSTSGSFTQNMGTGNFNPAGLTQTYTITTADIPAGAIITSFDYDVTVSTRDWLSEISLVMSYPGGSVTAGSFGGNGPGSGINQTGSGTISGSPSALATYTFVWDDAAFPGLNTVDSASFTINYSVLGPRVQIMDAANAPTNMVTAADDITLEPGEIMTVTFDVTVNAGTEGTTLTNTANVDADDFVGISDTAINNVAAAVVDLSLTKAVDNAIPKVGDDIVYTLTVKNEGSVDATGVQVTDTLPTGLTYVLDDSATTSTTYTSNVWNIGNMTAGQTIILKITATITQAGTIVNTSEVTQSNQLDTDSTPNNGN